MTKYLYGYAHGPACASVGQVCSYGEGDFGSSPTTIVPSLPPNLRRLLRAPPRSPPQPPVQRRRPRLWTQSTWTQTAAALENSSKRRRCSNDYYESDDEDDSSSDDEEDECILPKASPPAKKLRQRYCTLTIRGTPSWLARCPLVTFSDPLVTEVRTRPRTTPEEKSTLFYCRTDERKFREEYRRERRMRLAGDWKSDDDEEEDSPASSDDNSDEGCYYFIAQTTDAAGTPEKDAKYAHQVSESSSSNEEEGGPDESSTSSQSDEDEQDCHASLGNWMKLSRKATRAVEI